MNKLASIIDNLNYKDLKALEKDLYEGNIGRLIKKNLSQLEENFPEKTCPVCGSSIKTPAYVLEFGPDDFRKRANFCGLDCLSFFVTKLGNESKLKH
jgi:hypothetical protein